MIAFHAEMLIKFLHHILVYFSPLSVAFIVSLANFRPSSHVILNPYSVYPLPDRMLVYLVVIYTVTFVGTHLLQLQIVSYFMSCTTMVLYTC